MNGFRVAYVLRVFPKLSETFVAGELAELSRRGVELRVLSLTEPAEALRHRIVGEAGLDAVTCYEPERFTAELEDFGPHLVHAHFATEATAAARELAATAGVPYTFTAHGYDIYRKPPDDFAARASAAAAVVTVSKANASHIKETFGVSRERLHVIPCGVDVEHFSPNGGPPEPPLVLAVARLNPVKRLDILLDACGLLRDREIPFRCVIVGEGRCRPELERQHRDLGLERIVSLQGAAEHEQVRAWWRRAAIGTLSSEREGMPVALMEAAACAVPVVAPAVGGVPELVEDGVTGFVVSPLDPPALAGGLERLLRDADLRERMGAAARVRALERFSVARQVDSLLAVWWEALAA